MKDLRFLRMEFDIILAHHWLHSRWLYIMIILYSVHMWYYIYTAVCISLCTNTSVL